MGRPKGSKNKPKVKPAEVAPVEAKPLKLEKPVEATIAAPVETPKAEKKPEPKPAAIVVPVDPETQKAIDKARKEFMDAMERFSKEVKVGDPDAVQKLFSYIPNPNPGVVW